MRICKNEMRMGVLSLAVSSALALMFATPMAAYAEESLEDEVAAIRHPTNYIEVGAENVSKDSAKFGEYSGLNKKGGKVITNISVRGGDAYEGGDGTMRWSVTGRDLGTTSRELGATAGNQGSWNLSIGYDELRHTITDTYQTPLQGSMGGNTFTLPANFGAFDAATVASSVRNLGATRLGAFHTEDVGTTRKNTSMGVGVNLSPELSLKFDYNHLAQSGAKLMASAADGRLAATGTWRAEAVSVLMNPTNYKTDTFNLALNWKGEQGHLSGSYNLSTFRDGYDRLSWENAMLSGPTTSGTVVGLVSTSPGAYQTVTMSTAPDNVLQQLNLSGGYALSPATKLVGGISYGRNTQNTGFLTGMPEIVLAPQASLIGLVVTKHVDLKLTNQTTKELMLSATAKYNERNNRSPSNLYQYYAINNSIVGSFNGSANGVDAAANAPYSNKKTELGLAGDYRLDKTQTIRLAYDLEKINRWCSNYALSANCLVSPDSIENKVGIKYKVKASDNVSLNAGYSHAKRNSGFDHTALTPLAGLDGNSLTYVNAQDYPGFSAVSYASRKQDTLKVGVNWHGSEKLELSMDGRYVDDKYDSTLGVQGSKTTGINLDSTYSYSEEASVSAYASWRNSKKDMRIGAAGGTPVADNTATSYALLVAPTNVWTNKLDESGQAIGLSTKQKLMGGKLDLSGDLSYSIDKSRYGTQVPYLATCSAVGTLTCGDLPDISNKLVTLKLTGIYALDQSSKISVGYMFQKLTSEDYSYNAFQYGYSSLRLMPTNQQAGSYVVNVIGASYIYNFK